jgi:hypothetical protein
MPDDTAKAPKGLAVFLVVVWQFVEPALHGDRRAKAIDDAPLGSRECQRRRSCGVGTRERQSAAVGQ